MEAMRKEDSITILQLRGNKIDGVGHGGMPQIIILSLGRQSERIISLRYFQASTTAEIDVEQQKQKRDAMIISDDLGEAKEH